MSNGSITVACVLLFGSLFGLILCITVVYLIVVKTKLSATSAFHKCVLSLILTDILQMSNFIIFAVPSTFVQASIFKDEGAEVSGFLNNAFYRAHVMNTLLIAWNRFMVMCFGNASRFGFHSSLAVQIAIVWISALVTTVGIRFISECKLLFNAVVGTYTVLCDPTSSMSLIMNIVNGVIFGLIILFYILIFIKFRIMKSQVSDEQIQLNSRKHERKLIVQSAIIGLSLVINNIIFNFVSKQISGLFLTILAYLFVFVNCWKSSLLLLLFNSQLKAALKTILNGGATNHQQATAAPNIAAMN